MSEPVSLNLDASIAAAFPPARTEKECVFLNSLAFATDLAALDVERIGRTGTRGADEAAFDALVPMEDQQ